MLTAVIAAFVTLVIVEMGDGLARTTDPTLAIALVLTADGQKR